MSAIMSIETPDNVVLLTDGAVYDADDILTNVKRKVFTSDKVPIAIANRGHQGMAEYASKLIIEIVEALGLDASIERIEELLKQFKDNDATDGLYRFELIIAGISDEFGPIHLIIHSTALERGLYRSGGTMVRSTSGAGMGEMGIRLPFKDETAEHYVRENGVAIFEFYRRQLNEAPRAKGSVSLVGGQLDLTIVSRTGVTVETIHRWDDKVGELINPFADHQTVKTFPGMTRQQRRAAERALQRKRVA